MSNELVYVLKLAEYKWYVDRCPSAQLAMRLAEHFRGQGHSWTRLFTPVALDAVYSSGDSGLEHRVTLAYARMVGWMNVRGGDWNNWQISYKPKDFRPKLMTYLDPEHLKVYVEAPSPQEMAAFRLPPLPLIAVLRQKYDAWVATLRPSLQQAMHPTAGITRR